MLNIGWFSTGRDEAARQLLQAVQDNIQSGDIDGKISFVFSNRDPGESQESDLFFELVDNYRIPLICFSHRKFKARLLRGACPEGQEILRGVYPERDSSVVSLPQNDRRRRGQNDKGRRDGNDKMGVHDDIALTGEENKWRLKYDREVRKRIEKFAPDLCVLAGYMLIIGEELCQKYSMLNLHPAPPGGPVGSWQEVTWNLIENKAQKAGAMIHLVTPELDRGPIVAYCIFPINHEPFDRYWQKGDKEMLFQLIRQHELAREFPLIIATLKALSQGEIGIRDSKVIDAQRKSIDGYDLSSKINKLITT